MISKPYVLEVNNEKCLRLKFVREIFKPEQGFDLAFTKRLSQSEFLASKWTARSWLEFLERNGIPINWKAYEINRLQNI